VRNLLNTIRWGLLALVGTVLLLGVLGETTLAQDGAPADTTGQTEADALPEPTDLERAEDLLRAMEAELDSIIVLQSRARKAENEELQLLRVQGSRHLAVIKDIQPELIKLLPGLDPADPRTITLRTGFNEFLNSKFDIYEQALRWWAREIEDLRGRRSDAKPELLGEIESQIGAARARLDDLWKDMFQILQVGDGQGIDTVKIYERFDRHLNNRAGDLLSRLEVAAQSRNNLRDMIRTEEKAKTVDSDISNLRSRLQYSEARVQGVAASLGATVDLLGKRGFETASYRQAIIKNTGEISERVLDPEVVVGLLKDLLGTVGEWFRDNGPTILVKLLIILTSVFMIRFLFRFFWWLLRLVRLINLTRLMLQLGQSLLNPIATVVGLFIGFWLIGADPTTLLTGAGVAGVIIGFALQDSLSNLAAGFFILATRPFDVDDVIRTGTVVGTVKAMWIANTTVVTFDGRRLLIPNRKIWADIIENHSVEPNRRVDVTVRVGFDEDIDRAIAILHDLVAKEDRLLENPEPNIFVAKWADSWVELEVRPWARNEHWWAMLTDLPRQVALTFADEGIEIPYPHLAMTDGPKPDPRPGKESE